MYGMYMNAYESKYTDNTLHIQKMVHTKKLGSSINIPSEDQQKDTDVNSPMSRTVQEYASVSVIHGLSYILSEGQSIKERMLWLIIVCSAVAFTIYQLPEFYREWQKHPVVTVLDTVSFPIEDIKFPAVTICPQGSSKDIMDAVLYKQLIEYILKEQENVSKGNGTNRQKREAPTEVSSDEIAEWVTNFIKDIYPGIKVKPTELTQLLTTNNPDNTLQNMAIFDPVSEEDCEVSADEIAALSATTFYDRHCPDEFEILDDEHCIHVLEQFTTYGEAEMYCDAKRYGSGRLLHLETQEKIGELHRYLAKGK